MTTTHRSLLFLLLCACGPTVATPDDDTGTTTGDAPPSTSGLTAGTSVGTTAPGTTGSTTTSTSSPTEPTTATTDTSSDSSDDCNEICCGFICPPDGADGGDAGCDPFLQDCPEGEKCMPWANDGEPEWNSVRCSPVADPPAVAGDPCMAEGSAWSGIDDCGLGLVCFWVDALTNEGVCAAQCTGTEANPTCADPSTTCVLDFDNVFSLCLPACDPLLQDCERGGCYPFGADEVQGFACGTTLPRGTADGEPCDHDWDCLPGSVCPTSADEPPACADGPCCAPLCDLTVPDACGPDRVCTELVEEGVGPPELANDGYCALP